jgi:lipoprotein-releasing system ATP-binding protein
MSEAAIEVRDLHKSYLMDKVPLHVLRGVSFTVPQGEFLGVVGASGSGKSTLLHLVGLLDQPDKGAIRLHGVETLRLPRRARDRIRCREVGFVFQFYHLLPELSVMENVLLPAQVDSAVLAWPGRRARARNRAQEVLERLGLGRRLRHRPRELSGGERQRVAIARALVNRPRLLLADEPTGNLDSRTGQQILELLLDFHKQAGQTTIMVTHDPALVRQTDRVVHIRDGRLAQG